MNWKRTMMLLLVATLTLPAFGQIKGTLGKLKQRAENVISGDAALSQDEVGAGLKEALDVGVQPSLRIPDDPEYALSRSTK